MRHPDDMAAPFEAARQRLWGIAYRMLGTAAEADDVVQDTFLRWQRADRDAIKSPEAWLVRTCTRLAIDALRAAKRSRVDYVGPWLPEPVAAATDDGSDLADTLSMAFLLVLERLSPAERAAFLLRDVFDYDYARVAEILGRSEAACRQLVTRGRKHARQARERFTPPGEAGERLLEAFLSAVSTGEVAPLEALLSRDVEMWADGGGKVLAAMKVIRGSDPVARFLAGLWRKNWVLGDIEVASVGGMPGLLMIADGRIYAALSLTSDSDGRVRQVLVMRNPDKLAGFNAASATRGEISH